MITVKELSKSYGKHLALDGLNFEVPEGQVLGLLGQNGAGKTSLLNLLSGYLPASRGSIHIGGIDMVKDPLHVRGMIGYLPENPPLYPEMTVMEYLRFCGELKSVDRRDILPHIEEIAALTGISEVMHRKLSNLSRGFRQRVGLTQALSGAPKVLLLDEPTSGFDPAQAVAFRGVISRLARSHTILFSSHILSEVQAVCDRVLILHQGRILYDHLMAQGQDEQPFVRFQLRAAMPRQTLLRALASLPSVLRARPYTLEGSFEEVEVEAKRDSGFERELMTLLSGLQSAILLLKPLEESLEQVFLRLTAGSSTEVVAS